MELPYDPDPDSLLLRHLKGDVEAYRRHRARVHADKIRERTQLMRSIALTEAYLRIAPTPAAAPGPPAPSALDIERIENACRDYPDAIKNALSPAILDVIEAWENTGE